MQLCRQESSSRINKSRIHHLCLSLCKGKPRQASKPCRASFVSFKHHSPIYFRSPISVGGHRSASPGYRLAIQRPFPTAAEDRYSALVFLKNHAREFGIRRVQIIIGGESAGGGLCAAVCMMAGDRKSVNITFQMPLYPVLDDRDTESSRDNHRKVWNTWKNHLAWKLYLRGTQRRKCPSMPPPQGHITIPVCLRPTPSLETGSRFMWKCFGILKI